MLDTIILVEDESSIADTIVYALETEGYRVTWFATAGETLTALKTITPDFMILDVGLPDMSGFDLCREIRKSSSVPLLFLTARGEEIDRVVGLELGADDYMVKPFSPRELVARVRAHLRRASLGAMEKSSSQTSAEEFTHDKESHKIAFEGISLELSRYEYLILALLIDHPERVYSRDVIMEQVWDEPDVSLERTIDTHIKTIRAKIKTIQSDANPIKTRRGFGYSYAG